MFTANWAKMVCRFTDPVSINFLFGGCTTFDYISTVAILLCSFRQLQHMSKKKKCCMLHCDVACA
jgi:hypothetical protein